MFNTIVTNFAPACYALFEQDLNPKDSPRIYKAMPKLYQIFKHKDLFSYGNFIFWFFKAAIQSLIIFYVSFYCSNESAITPDGFLNDLWGMSIMAYSSTFGVIMVELCIETSNYTAVVHFFYWFLAVVLYFPCFVFLYDTFLSAVQYYAADLFGYGKFWLVLLINMGICGTYQYTVYVFKKFYKQEEVDRLQLERYYQKKDKKLKQIQISKRIEFNKKLSKAASQNGEPEYEMDNLARESEMAENVAYEQASDKRNVTDYNFTHKPKNEG